VKSADGSAEVFLLAGRLAGNPIMTIPPSNPISPTQASPVVSKTYAVSASRGSSTLNLPGTLNIYFSQGDIARLNASSLGLDRWDDLSARWDRVQADVDWKLPFRLRKFSGTGDVRAHGAHALSGILADDNHILVKIAWHERLR
jgi:hypothetical protein